MKIDAYVGARGGICVAVWLAAAAALADVSASWNVDAGGSWLAGANWSGGAAATGATGVATFAYPITASRTVTVDSSPWTINAMVFSNTGECGWTVAGGALDLAGTTPTFTVNGAASTATVSSALGVADFAKNGTGTLRLTGTSSVGLSNITAGTVIIGGGSVTNATSSSVDIRNACAVLVTNALWNLNSAAVYVGALSGYTANNNLTVGGGGVVTNGGTLTVGRQSSNNSLVVTNGGRLYTAGTSISFQGNTGDFLRVTGANSLWNNNGGGLTLGGNPGFSGGALLVDNDGVATNVGGIVLYGTGCNGNFVAVTNGGVLYATSITWNQATNMVNAAIVQGGGVMELASSITLGRAGDAAVASNAVTISDGGVLQFGTAAPAISIVSNGTSGNSITITNGTLSYRGVTNVDVKANLQGSGVGLFTWRGTNTLRLDGASTAGSGQDYTFAAGLGATNYCTLELMNGATYQGGVVTVGNGGTLRVPAGTTGSVAGALAIQAGGALDVTLNGTNSYSALVASDSVTLGGDLNVRFGTLPGIGDSFLILNKAGAGAIAGRFSCGSSLKINYGGKNYLFVVRYDAGDGNDVSLIRVTDGTVLIIQ